MTKKKEIITTGERYAIVDREAGLVRYTTTVPLELEDDGTAKNRSINVPAGCIAVPAPLSLGLVVNRPVKGIKAFEDAIAEAAEEDKAAAAAKAKTKAADAA